jgi:hypothetical protein
MFDMNKEFFVGLFQYLINKVIIKKDMDGNDKMIK